MKNKTFFYFVFLAGLLLTLLNNCKKEAVVPTVTLASVTNITSNSATIGVDVISNGGATVINRGVCWGSNQTLTTSDSRTDHGLGSGSFYTQIVGLNPVTTYYIRAYATNTKGTAYSSLSTFTTGASAPVLTTTVLTANTPSTATSGGSISTDGGLGVTARGVCWATTQNPTPANSKTTDGTGPGIFTSNLTGLLPSTTYYARAYATNSIGTTYGNQVTITTTAFAPVLTTTATSAIASTTATSGGNITSDGGSAVKARGVCWATVPNPTIANSKTVDGVGTGTYTSSLMGLTEKTFYYLRAYATNSNITSYGNEVYLRTLSSNNNIIFNPNLTYGTVADNDGNVYETITIGTQTWMAENLKTTRYRNGELIPNVTGGTAWVGLITGAYCWYNNDAANKVTYGGLYNWYAVADSSNIAPVGWHVATDVEWTTLTDFLGDKIVAGGKLKETGTSHWFTSNSGATNSSGFTALPGGYRYQYRGTFNEVGFYGTWWSSTAYSASAAWTRNLNYNNADVNRRYYGKQQGYSVRCVRD